MVFASSVAPERRAELRRLKAEFEAAFGAMDGEMDRSSAAYHTAHGRYRAWINALDAVALALLDDIDAYERIGAAAPRRTGPDLASASTGAAVDGTNLDGLFSGIADLQRTADLIGSAAAPAASPRKSTPRNRAMNVIGSDRAARLWSFGAGADDPGGLAHHR